LIGPWGEKTKNGSFFFPPPGFGNRHFRVQTGGGGHQGGTKDRRRFLKQIPPPQQKGGHGWAKWPNAKKGGAPRPQKQKQKTPQPGPRPPKGGRGGLRWRAGGKINWAVLLGLFRELHRCCAPRPKKPDLTQNFFPPGDEPGKRHSGRKLNFKGGKRGRVFSQKSGSIAPGGRGTGLGKWKKKKRAGGGGGTRGRGDGFSGGSRCRPGFQPPDSRGRGGGGGDDFCFSVWRLVSFVTFEVRAGGAGDQVAAGGAGFPGPGGDEGGPLPPTVGQHNCAEKKQKTAQGRGSFWPPKTFLQGPRRWAGARYSCREGPKGGTRFQGGTPFRFPKTKALVKKKRPPPSPDPGAKWAGGGNACLRRGGGDQKKKDGGGARDMPQGVHEKLLGKQHRGKFFPRGGPAGDGIFFFPAGVAGSTFSRPGPFKPQPGGDGFGGVWGPRRGGGQKKGVRGPIFGDKTLRFSGVVPDRVLLLETQSRFGAGRGGSFFFRFGPSAGGGPGGNWIIGGGNQGPKPPHWITI